MNNRRWTEEEDRVLEECIRISDENCDMAYSEAIKRLDRSMAAIRSRAYVLGLSKRHKSGRNLYEEWILFNKIRNMLREVKGMPPVSYSENPFEDGKVRYENEI